jgi:hypothetical protein
MTQPGRRFSRFARSLAGAALVAVLAVWPSAAIARSDAAHVASPVGLAAAPGAGAATGGLQPSIHYEEALALASDDLDFVPGGRVSVGFVPRPDDEFEIDGEPPGPAR